MMYKNILIPVLFDEGHDAQASYDVAKSLAAEGAKFTVVHVMEAIPNYVAVEIPTGVIENNRREVEKALTKSTKSLPNATPMLIHGQPARAIVDCAHANGIDCIVIASHQLGLSDIFLGSTAAKVVRHAKCSVHVMR
jgi:universal stress protein F